MALQRFNGYMAGVNLGGWISQCPYKYEHHDTFITADDFKKIADFGFDHVRVPVDYQVIESDEKPFEYIEKGFGYLDFAIENCKKYNLNVIIDLHHAPGYSFGTLNKNTLFSDEIMQRRFISIWETIAHRYIAERDNVVFELLNEVVDKNSDRWNQLSAKTIAAIREIDKDRVIIIGGNHYNSMTTMKELPVFDDKNIVYNFHYYLPFVLTHQKGSWTHLKDLKTNVTYPADTSLYAKADIESGGNGKEFSESGFDTVDIDFLEMLMKPALDFINERNISRLYCGEYGVIDHADVDTRERWHKDFSSLLLKYNIGRAVWSYRRMNFKMVENDGSPVSQKLIDAVTMK